MTIYLASGGVALVALETLIQRGEILSNRTGAKGLCAS